MRHAEMSTEGPVAGEERLFTVPCDAYPGFELVSVWVPAPESNPSDVKGEGSRKNNMEITWTVRAPPAHPRCWPGSLGALALCSPGAPQPQAGSDYLPGVRASRNQTGEYLRARFKTGAEVTEAHRTKALL